MSSEMSRGDLLRRLWVTLAAPMATELGSVATLVTPAWVGVLVGVVALVVLELVLPATRPSDGTVRAAVLVAGPPLRYLLLIIAVWKVWFPGGEGIVPALLLLLVLGFGIPMAAFLFAQSRSRHS